MIDSYIKYLLQFLLIIWALSSCSESLKFKLTEFEKETLYSEAIQLSNAWVTNAPLSSGFQQANFNEDWSPSEQNETVDLTSQARLIYVYSSAYQLSGQKKYLDALINATNFLLTNMKNNKNNGWYKIVNKDGQAIQSSVHPYSYSFVILALSHAYKVTSNKQYKQAAIDTWEMNVWVGLNDARNFQNNNRINTGNNDQPPSFWSQNAYMHLFEALLSLHDISQNISVWQDIESMAFFVENKLVQPCKCIPEWYTAGTYQPAKAESASELYLGHQVEWAYLLSSAVKQGLDKHYSILSSQLFDFAITYGVDVDTGALRAISNMNGKIINHSYWWWAQAELLRASLVFSTTNNKNKAIYEKTRNFTVSNLIDRKSGGWYNSLPSMQNNSMRKKAIGYHAIAFYMEALTPQ